jgi:hypothetical protein
MVKIDITKAVFNKLQAFQMDYKMKFDKTISFSSIIEGIMEAD